MAVARVGTGGTGEPYPLVLYILPIFVHFFVLSL